MNGDRRKGRTKNVEVCNASPLLRPQAPIARGVPMHALSGKPDVSPLPRHSRSGTTKSASDDPACGTARRRMCASMPQAPHHSFFMVEADCGPA